MAADNRLITRSGQHGVRQREARRSQFSLDSCGSLLTYNWICFILIFASLFVVSWMTFACLWYAISHVHGDLDERATSKSTRPCVKGLDRFADAVFFSIDLQSTLGYGRSEIQDECPVAVVLFFVQCLTGILIQCAAVTLLFTKFTAGSGANLRREVRFPDKLQLIKMEKEVAESFRSAPHDHSKSYDNVSDLSQSKFIKHAKNPHAKSSKLKSKNKDRVTVSSSPDYLLRLEFQNAKELMSVSMHGLLIVKKVMVSGNETNLHIAATKSIKFVDATIDTDSMNRLVSNGHTYIHKVDRHSPLRPYLLSMMKGRPEKTTATHQRPNKAQPSPAQGYESLHDEVLRMKIPDFELPAPVKNFIIDLRSSSNNNSCNDDASVESDTASADGRRTRNKKPTKHKAIFKKPQNLDLHDEALKFQMSQANPLGRSKTSDLTESSASSISGRAALSQEKLEQKQLEELEDFPSQLKRSFQLEIVFIVEGTEAGSGTIVEATASYTLDDVATNF